MVKWSLRYIAVSRLTNLEFDLTVQNIAAVINNRPLAFNLSSEQVISPNQILLGQAFSDSLPPEGNEPASIEMMSHNTKAIVQSWFDRWTTNVLPRLFITGNRKHFRRSRDLQPGDICLWHQRKGKHATISYKYCKVIEVIPSRDNLVRTLKVVYLNYPSKSKRLWW